MNEEKPQVQPPSDETLPAAEPAPGVQIRKPSTKPHEIGGRDGPDPTRYGDWEKNGRCIDF